MQLETMTPTLMRQILRGHHPYTELASLLCIPAKPGSTAVQRAIQLQEYIHNMVIAQWRNGRLVEGLPPIEDGLLLTRTQLRQTIAQDFATLNGDLKRWSTLYHRYICPVPLTTDEIAEATALVPRQIQRWLSEGEGLLATHLQRAETAAQEQLLARSELLRRHLPPPEYSQLFGVDALLAQVQAWFEQPDGARFLSVEGLGGSGKTAVTRAFAYHIAESAELAGILWISARQTWLEDGLQISIITDPARSFADVVTRLTYQLGQDHLAGLSTKEKLAGIRPLLAQSPYLIIIDNLETLADVAVMLPALTAVCGAAKFIFTSRHTMAGYPYVHCFALPPLTLADSQMLIEAEANRRGRAIQLGEAEMEPLYRLVGGLPLALKLVAAQIGHLSFAQVMQGLQKAHLTAPEQLYQYIYRRTWQQLTNAACELLISFLFISPDGEEEQWIRERCGLAEAQFDEAMIQLRAFSLVEVSGSLQAPLYRLHRLTTTFLQTDVLLGWDAATPEVGA